MSQIDPERTAREVLEACADCDVCRFLMDTSCLFFPELYRLYDREMTGGRITSDDLRRLVDLCTFCGQCTCPNIRAGIIEAKTQFIERDGLAFGVRLIEDVERIARVCGVSPGLANTFFQAKPTGRLLKAAMGIHPARRMPRFPEEPFTDFAKKNNLTNKRDEPSSRKLAYFAGCTGKFLFPEVPKAVIEVLRHKGFEVYFPEQKCCGMPSLLEGDRKLTLEFIRFNMDHLAEAVAEGYDIVCSCPTCGYLFKTILGEGAYFSKEYQEAVGGDDKGIKIPIRKGLGAPGDRPFKSLPKIIYKDLLKDEGYFSSISPLKRISVSENTYDLGEYLAYLQKNGELSTDFHSVAGHLVYYPPCHLREQGIGTPYVDLLKMIPGISLEPVQDRFYCCGLGGIMGFKKSFHESSLTLGSDLIEKIREMNPDMLVTDCLSCRMQFNQLLPYEVVHPIEILKESLIGIRPTIRQSKKSSEPEKRLK
jgi:glycerol-3-phosphate dehydrogenase subunit C